MQSTQVAALVAAVAAEALPDGHLVHTAVRIAGWYCPAVQLVHELWPAPLYLPAGHVAQARLTFVLVYLPPGQLLHTWLLEYLPVGHTATHCAAVTRHLCEYSLVGFTW
jgi:hypothetical protein